MGLKSQLAPSDQLQKGGFDSWCLEHDLLEQQTLQQ
jgi:hypothetical protein